MAALLNVLSAYSKLKCKIQKMNTIIKMILVFEFVSFMFVFCQYELFSAIIYFSNNWCIYVSNVLFFSKSNAIL